MPNHSHEVVSSDNDDETQSLVPLEHVPIEDRKRLERALSATILCCGDCPCSSNDTVLSQLSFDERFAYLVHGYIRNQNENVPEDVMSLCMQYIGGPRMLNVANLMTLDEHGYGCCGHATFCGKLPSRSRAFCAHLFYGCRVICGDLWDVPLLYKIISLLIFIVFCAKDIAALVIASCYECNSAISIGSLNVSTWLYAGAIVNIFVYVTLIPLLMFASRYYRKGWQCNFLYCESFHFIWSVLGFILWSHMESGLACTSMVLSWCIIEIAWALVPCCLYVFIKYMESNY